MKDDYILIVDDELPIREMIHTSLDMAGFQCLQAEDAKQAHQIIVDQRPALILLDWMLPGGVSGVDLCRRLKRDENLAEIPVIMLTARGEEDHKVQGLDAGADDYVVKPYAFAELLARVQNVFRHHIAAQVVASPQTLRVADLELDMIKRVATRAEQSISLTAKEYALLELLMRKTGQVLSRTTIASLVWDMNFDSDTNVIDVAVKRLRSKVDKPFDKPLIHTVRGMGYKLEESRDA